MEKSTTNLILVCCHGIWLNGPSLGHDEAEWLIAAFQKGETPTFIQHIKAGLRLLSSAPDSILIFSGYCLPLFSMTISWLILIGAVRGPTRSETMISEADSYLQLAQVHDYWGLLHSELEYKVVVERRSLDSFHNLVFSLTKFYEVTGAWPKHVTIISNEFKRPRFLDLHCKALSWPADRVSFVGIDPDYMDWDLERAMSVRQGELRNGFELWQRDMLGINKGLEGKREMRNPWQVNQDLFENDTARDVSGIHYSVLSHREILEKGPQPWEH